MRPENDHPIVGDRYNVQEGVQGLHDQPDTVQDHVILSDTILLVVIVELRRFTIRQLIQSGPLLNILSSCG